MVARRRRPSGLSRVSGTGSPLWAPLARAAFPHFRGTHGTGASSILASPANCLSRLGHGSPGRCFPDHFPRPQCTISRLSPLQRHRLDMGHGHNGVSDGCRSGNRTSRIGSTASWCVGHNNRSFMGPRSRSHQGNHRLNRRPRTWWCISPLAALRLRRYWSGRPRGRADGTLRWTPCRIPAVHRHFRPTREHSLWCDPLRRTLAIGNLVNREQCSRAPGSLPQRLPTHHGDT